MSPHVRVCLAFALFAIPVAIADAILLRRGSGGWISLDFSGLLIGAYLIFLPVHFIVSTAAVRSFPQASLWLIHFPSALLSVGILSAGVYFFSELKDKAENRRYQEERAARKQFEDVIVLNRWKFSPVSDSTEVIAISVTVRESGRFAVGATGRDEGDYGEWYFQSENEEQREVAKGEQFDFQIPIKRSKKGIPKDIAITLYLFADSTGSAGKDIIRVFQSAPVTTADDGQYYYAPLPDQAGD